MTSTLSTQAATLHRLAALITEHDLPPADITVHADCSIISVGFYTSDHGENGLRRWAQAVDLIVGSQPHEDQHGCATELLHASGRVDGVHFMLGWARPVLATVTA